MLRRRDSEPVCEIETFDPKRAADALANQAQNRSVKVYKVNQFAETMAAGKWRLAEPLMFNSDGSLFQGQHRLKAVVKCGIPQDFFVMRGMPKDTMLHVDTGSTRSVSDFFKIMGMKNVTLLSAICKIVVANERGASSPTVARMIARETPIDVFLERGKNDTLMSEVASLITGAEKEIRVLIKSVGFSGWFLYCGFFGMDENADLFDDFLSILSGRDVSHSKNDPAWVLRNRLIRHEPVNNKTNSIVRLALTIKAWNKFYLGEQVGTLRWRPFGTKAEKFPSMLTDKEVACNFK